MAGEATRNRSNTRARLIDAADRLFIERRTMAVPIDDVCAAAGFSRGAYYSNFSSVEDLFFALYERRTDELLERIAAASPRVDGSDDDAADARPRGLEDVVSSLLETIPAEVEWYALRASFAMRSQNDPALAATLHDHGERFRSGVMPFIEAAVRAAGREPVGDPEETTRVIIAAHVGAVLQSPLVDDPERLRHDTVLAALTGATRPA